MGHAPVVYVSNPGGRTLRPTFGGGNTGKEGGDCCSLAKEVGDHVNELVIASHAITDTHVLAISCVRRFYGVATLVAHSHAAHGRSRRNGRTPNPQGRSVAGVTAALRVTVI